MNLRNRLRNIQTQDAFLQFTLELEPYVLGPPSREERESSATARLLLDAMCAFLWKTAGDDVYLPDMLNSMIVMNRQTGCGEDTELDQFLMSVPDARSVVDPYYSRYMLASPEMRSSASVLLAHALLHAHWDDKPAAEG